MKGIFFVENMEKQQVTKEQKAKEEELKKKLPSPSQWAVSTFHDHEMRSTALNYAYDVLESVWTKGVEGDPELLKAFHEQRKIKQAEHDPKEEYPDKTFTELPDYEQKYYCWRFEQTIQAASIHNSELNTLIRNLSKHINSDISSNNYSDSQNSEPTVLQSKGVVSYDIAAGGED
jgi:hypothetical protein